MRINALDFLAQQGLGLVLHRLGRSAEAIPHYRQALRLRPDHAETHHNLGVALANTAISPWPSATSKRHSGSGPVMRTPSAIWPE